MGPAEFGAALRERTHLDRPFLLTVGANRTGGAFLGNVAEGWAEPLTWDNELPACPDEHLLRHLELAEWPDDEVIGELAFAVGDRLEDTWGVRPTPLSRSYGRPGGTVRHGAASRVGP